MFCCLSRRFLSRTWLLGSLLLLLSDVAFWALEFGRVVPVGEARDTACCCFLPADFGSSLRLSEEEELKAELALLTGILDGFGLACSGLAGLPCLVVPWSEEGSMRRGAGLLATKASSFCCSSAWVGVAVGREAGRMTAVSLYQRK